GIVYDPALESGKPDWWHAQEEEQKPLTIEQYAAGVVPTLKQTGLKILLEPGRYIVGNAGVMLTRCLYEKKGSAKTFRVVDAGMNDLIRPALYEGHHEIAPLNEPAQGGGSTAVDVVGPVCETGDFFCQNRELPDFAPGEAIALLSAGAYGFVMASNYNSRGLPVEILVDGSEARVIRPRQTMDDILASEKAAL
ncbi:MAG: diaminopimelate decarboxylase family protein, partial [Akkermansiaceae bacterium]